jgi:hypothetical protein
VQARGAITAADSALDALPEDIVPADHRDDLDTALEATDAALELGRQACDIWEREATASSPTGWAKWVQDALAASAQIITVIKAAGVDIPPAVGMAIGGLQLLLPFLSGAFGG